MKALIDADVLSYEISSCGVFKDELTGELITRDFDFVSDLLDQRITEIIFESGADSATLYLTGDPKLVKHVNREAKWLDHEPRIFTPNFRIETAKAKPYKANRKSEKPFHFDNIRSYMYTHYECIVSDGMEADDLICIHLYEDWIKAYNDPDLKLNYICCTRDKDLRMCPGIHYGWKCGKQEQFGPAHVDELGRIELSRGSTTTIKGTGILFFYSQLITGDTVDNIPGLPKRGPVYAYNLLSECKSELDCFHAVRQAYEEHYGQEAWEDALREQADLLWMIRELNEDGTIKFYEWPTGGDLLGDQEAN